MLFNRSHPFSRIFRPIRVVFCSVCKINPSVWSILVPLLTAIYEPVGAQSVIVLDQCDFSYIDPQDQATHPNSGHDTLIYTSFFQEQGLRRAFYVDLNAFGGQQVDRARVWAILPDQSLKALGAIAFGNCVECVNGFALVHEGILQVTDVDNQGTMNMWLQSFNQPPFALPGNLQTLAGVGRVSGLIPSCAIGFKVEFIVFSNPASTTTEFSCHILCPEVTANCTITKSGRIDCQKDSLYLEAVLPAGCFPPQTKVTWRHADGWAAESPNAQRPLAGNLGWYFLTVEDECCSILDSINLESPPFADAGPDLDLCENDALNLAGTGGFDHRWTLPSGVIQTDSVLVFNPLSADLSGPYILHAVNSEGCPDTDTLHLTVHSPPMPQIEYAPPCIGDTLTLAVVNTGDYAGFEWSDPQGGPLSQHPVIPDFQPQNIGEYTLTVTDTFGCMRVEHLEIAGMEPPDLDADIQESCDSVRIFLSPADYQYLWNNEVRGPVLATATGGLFEVTVTDPAGCSAVKQFELPQPEGPEIAIAVTHPECPNEPGIVEVALENPDQPAIFSIDGGITYTVNSTFKDLLPGHYTLTVQDDLGCIQVFPVEITAPDTLFVSLPLDQLEVRPLTPVNLTAQTYGQIARIQWLPEAIDTGAPETGFIATTNMDIRVIVEDARGCLASDGFPLTIILGEIFIPNAFSPDGDGFNDRFTFFSDGGSGEIITALRVFDRWGALLFETNEMELNDESRGWDGTAGGKILPQGVYTYHGYVRFGNGVVKAYKGDIALLRK